MSLYHKLGSLAWTIGKLKDTVDAAIIARNALDPATRDRAAYGAAIKP
jgi:hypothetical protein